MPYVTYVEFLVDDVDPAAEFYQSVFDWKTEAYGDDSSGLGE